MTIQGARNPAVATRPLPGNAALPRTLVGGFSLSMGGEHLGIVAADAQFYRPFADQALFAFVETDGSTSSWLTHPPCYGALPWSRERQCSVCRCLPAALREAGVTGVIVVHLLLMLFSFGIWAWSIPAPIVLDPPSWP